MTDRRTSIDPALADLLSAGDARQRQQRQSPKQRQRAAREAAKQSARNRLSIDISPELDRQIVDLAAQLGVPISQAVAGLMLLGWPLRGQLDNYLHPSRSPRYDYILALEDIADDSR